MIHKFRFPTLIHFGSGAITDLVAALKEQNIQHVLLVTDNQLVQLEPFAAVCQEIKRSTCAYTVFSECFGNPTLPQVKAGVNIFIETQATAIVAVGGGCALDVAKAMFCLHSINNLMPSWG